MGQKYLELIRSRNKTNRLLFVDKPIREAFGDLVDEQGFVMKQGA
jgi:hypothetical protein